MIRYSLIVGLMLTPLIAAADNQLLILDRSLVDNQYIFGSNAASPPTLSKRAINTTHRGVFGLSPSDSCIKASTSIAGGILTGNPALTFADVGATGDTISRPSMGGGSWINDGFAAGQYIFVRKSGPNNNIARALLKNVTATTLTLDATPLTNESSVSNVEVRGGDRFVTVENFGLGAPDDNRRANAANITIDGNQPVPQYPQGHPTETPLSPWGATYTADGIALDGAFATVENVQVRNCRGVGVAHGLADGRLFDSEIHNCHTGVRVPSSDMEVRRCRIYGCRDACLFLARDSGNVQSTDNHCYGARIACYNEGAFPYRATGDTYADSWIGYFGSGYGIRTVLSNILFQHNTVRDCVFSNFGCSLENSVVQVMRDVQTYNHLDSPTAFVPTYNDKKVGVELAGDNCSIRGGMVELINWIHEGIPHIVTGNAAEAIWVSGDGCVIETQLLDNDGVNGSIGIHVKGGVKGLKIDCVTTGFHDTNDRIIVFDDGANCRGLDITFRVSGMDTKAIDDYVDIASDWKGSIRFINAATGAVTSLTEGSAH